MNRAVRSSGSVSVCFCSGGFTFVLSKLTKAVPTGMTGGRPQPCFPKGNTVSSRRWNLRNTEAKTTSRPRRGRPCDPFRGERTLLSCLSVGFTYGYSPTSPSGRVKKGWPPGARRPNLDKLEFTSPSGGVKPRPRQTAAPADFACPGKTAMHWPPNSLIKARRGGSSLKDVKNEGRPGNVYENKGTSD